MSITIEQFLSFSESEQLQTVKELNDTGNVKTIIDVLTRVGIENLSIPLLGELGRAYNNNGNEKEAIKVLESIDEAHRDAVWYYRCAFGCREPTRGASRRACGVRRTEGSAG